MTANLKIVSRYLIIVSISIFFVFLGMRFIQETNGASPIWPASGIFAYFAFRYGLKIVPLLGFSYGFAQFLNGSGISSIICGSTGSAIETLIFAKILNDYSQQLGIQSLGKRTFKLIFGSLVGASISALIGVSELHYSGFVSSEAYLGAMASWVLGDMLGFLFLSPLLLFISTNNLKAITKLILPKIDGLLIILSTIVLSFYFKEFNGAIYIVFIALLYASIRGGHAALVSYSVVTYILAIYLTLIGHSPFNVGGTVANLIALQIFLFSFTVLCHGLDELNFQNLARFMKISILLLVTLISVAYYFLYNAETKKDDVRLKEYSLKFLNDFDERFADYAILLRSGRAFFAGSENVTAQEWRKFVASTEINKNFPGINGTGYVREVPEKNLETFKKEQIHQQGEFSFKRLGEPIEAEKAFVITFIEPFEQNRQARGLDLNSEIRRSLAAMRAKETNQVAATQPIQLVQDNKNRPGLLIFLSLGFNESQDFRGWIYAPLIIENFINSIMFNLSNEVEVSIFSKSSNGESVFSNKKEYAGFTPLLVTRELTLGGQSWYINFSTTPSFISEKWHSSAWIMVFSNLSILLIVAAFASIFNVSEIAQKMANSLSEQLIQSSKMSALGEMAGGIAHEINNPLSVMKARSEFIVKGIETGKLTTEQIIISAKKITDTADRIAKIIKGLKNFSRSSEGEPFTLVSLPKIIEDTLDFCKERFHSKNVELHVDSVPQIQILCREVQIVQVILNLLNNSFDAIQPINGEKWIKLSFELATDRIDIRVTDSGLGIKKEIADKIMQPFFTTKEVGKGTGLGLSISKGIIESHHGSLTLDQTQKNTSFVITLPIATIFYEG